MRMRNPFFGVEAFFKLFKYKKQQDDALKILHSHAENVIKMRREEIKNSNKSLDENSDLGIRQNTILINIPQKYLTIKLVSFHLGP